MNILPNISIVGLSLYLEKHKILVLSDTHIGYEEALNKQGILIPRLQFKEILNQLELIFKEVKPEMVAVLGDVKHEFGTISNQEWNDTLKLLDYLMAKVGKAGSKGKVVLIKGNHDTILGPLAKKKGLEIKESFLADDILLCHGHKLVDEKSKAFKDAKTIIIGHEHPAITLRDDVRTEKYKCFLLGKYRKEGKGKSQGKNLIVMPSFNFVTEGTDVLQEKLLSPFIKDIKDFEAFVIGDKTYKFGKVSKLQ